MWQEILLKINDLNIALKYVKKRGIEYANAEKEYKIELHKQILILRDEKHPATLISMLVYGVKEVAEKRLKRDIAEVNYKAAQEAINVYKKELTALENEYSREWSHVKKQT